jgi:hypothetical protein
MALTLLAPEVIFGFALSALWSARSNNTTLKRLASKDGVDWSIAHSFYADMGGFVLEFGEVPSRDTAETINGSPHHNEAQSTEAPRPAIPLSDIDEHASGTIPLLDWHRDALPSVSEHRPPSLSSSGRDFTPSSPQQAQDVEAAQHDTPHDRSGREHDAVTTKEGYFSVLDLGSHRLLDRIFGGLGQMDELDKLGTPRWKMDREYRRMVADIWNSPQSIEASHLQGNIWVLNARQLVVAIERGVISRLPQLSEDELEDKNKGDYILKVLALLQIVWMLVQLLVRWSNKRPVSQLEVMTLSFAACAVILYALGLSRPQGVETPTMVPAKRASLEDMRAILEARSSVLRIVRRLYTMPNNTIHGPTNAFLIGTGLGAVLFGGLHLIAFDFTFPTAIEKELWRVSSVVAVLMPFSPFTLVSIALCLGYFIHPAFMDEDSILWSVWVGFSYAAPVLAYIFARLFLMVESFRSLYYQPIDVFAATWAP